MERLLWLMLEMVLKRREMRGKRVEGGEGGREEEMVEEGGWVLGMGCGGVVMKGGDVDDEERGEWGMGKEGNVRVVRNKGGMRGGEGGEMWDRGGKEGRYGGRGGR